MNHSLTPSAQQARRTGSRSRTTYDRALDMLESRARSVVELRRMLLRKGESAADVDSAIERLRGAGLLDDASYARQLARSKALSAGQSRRRIAQELARKGVTRTVADAAIAEVFDEENVNEAATIERVARKKLKTLAKLDAATQKRRLYAFLVRRGYDSDAIGSTLRAVMSDSDTSD